MGRRSQSIAPPAAPSFAPSVAQGGDAAAGEDVTDLIARLHDLKTKGAITEVEFEAKKAELLAKIGK